LTEILLLSANREQLSLERRCTNLASARGSSRNETLLQIRVATEKGFKANQKWEAGRGIVQETPACERRAIWEALALRLDLRRSKRFREIRGLKSMGVYRVWQPSGRPVWSGVAPQLPNQSAQPKQRPLDSHFVFASEIPQHSAIRLCASASSFLAINSSTP
jgi:hypothetical protein